MKKLITAMSIVFIALFLVLIPTSSLATSSSTSGATVSNKEKDRIVLVNAGTYRVIVYVEGKKKNIKNCFISGFKAKLIYSKYYPSYTVCRTLSKKAYLKTVSDPYVKIKVVYKNKKVKKFKGRVVQEAPMPL